MKKWLFLLLIVVLYFYNFGTKTPTKVALADIVGLTGYAWSSNIGWIKMASDAGDSVAFQVSIDSTTKNLSGFAWSSNIGWINFAGPLATGETARPAISGTVDSGAKLDTSFSPSKLVGWARACSVFDSGCSGALKDPSLRGGWDGWISLTGSNHGVSFKNDTASNPNGFFCTPVQSPNTCFAWGADVLGWIDFSQVQIPSASLSLIFGVQAQPDFSLNPKDVLRVNFVADITTSSNQVVIEVIPIVNFTETVSFSLDSTKLFKEDNTVATPILSSSFEPTSVSSPYPNNQPKFKVSFNKIQPGNYYVKIKAESTSRVSRAKVPVTVRSITKGIKEI